MDLFHKYKIQQNVAVAAIYFAAGLLSLELHGPGTTAPLIWLPTGIAIAAVIQYGYGVLPGVILGAFAVVFYQSPPLNLNWSFVSVPLQVAAGPLQAFVGVWLLRAMGVKGNPLDTLNSTAKFIISCVVISPLFSSLPGITAIFLYGWVPPEDFIMGWANWWFGDALGVLIAAPMLILFVALKIAKFQKYEWIELSILTSITSVVLFFIFSGFTVSHEIELLGIYSIFPFVIWAGIRFSPIVSSTFVFVTACVAIIATSLESGPFYIHTEFANLMVNIFIGVLGATSLFLSIARYELQASNYRLAEALRDAQAADMAKSKFLSNISHELRTPLNAILGFSDASLISGENQVDEKRREEFFGFVHESGKYLQNIINNILEITDDENERIANDSTHIKTSELLSRIVSQLSDTAKSNNVLFATSIEDDDLCIFGDEDKLHNAFYNIIKNSIYACPDGGRVRIEQTLIDDGSLIISISDSGCGMSKDEVSTALEVFGRTDFATTNAIEGIGIGLPLAKKVIEEIGGSLFIQSTKGEGTIVMIKFPEDCVVHVNLV